MLKVEGRPWVLFWHDFGRNDEGQDIAEYAVMLAVILVLVVVHRAADRLQRQQRFLISSEFYSVDGTSS